jgi:NRAMP (natural resistance-associated macrophage protein)-like metal ion transporter
MCSIAGAQFGYSLVWALIISILITLVIQSTVVRISIVSDKPLSKLLINQFRNKYLKFLSIFLLISAIFVGNAAYEAGNISGSVLGLELIFNDDLDVFGLNGYVILTGLIAFLIIFFGNNKFLERILISLVLVMSISFIFTVFLVGVDLGELISPSNFFKIPDGSLLIIAGLIGTTVVPYNIFLHSALVNEKWGSKNDLKDASFDTVFSILIGGIISLCILLTAAGLDKSNITSAIDLANNLEPLYGSFSKFVLAIGLFSAGLTSSITAPLAAAYVVNGCLDLGLNRKSLVFKLIALLVLLIGLFSSFFQINSIEIIKFAQITNGILLPLVVIFLFVLANNKLLVSKTNNLFQNIISFLVVVFCLLLCFRSILKVFS